MRNIRTEPAMKLRSLNSARLTNGCSAVAEWTRKTQMPVMARPSSIQVSVAPNQSLVSPRSSNICSAPMKRLSMAKPKKSNGRLRSVAVSATKRPMPATVSTPTGRLMKKTQRQLYVSVSQPPSVGPRIGATTMPAPQIAIAAPCRSRG